MDYADFRSGRVWLKATWGPDPDPNEPAEYQSKQIIIRFAYAPASISEEDIPLLVEFDRVRVYEAERMDDPVAQPDPPVESRAQKRARAKDERRADATPPGREPGPTAIAYLTRFVVDWDLNWQGEPWPPCEAAFRELELGLRMEMVATIVQDYLARPSRASSLMRSLGTTKGTGQTTPASSSNPDGSTDPASLPGSGSGTRNGLALLSGSPG